MFNCCHYEKGVNELRPGNCAQSRKSWTKIFPAFKVFVKKIEYEVIHGYRLLGFKVDVGSNRFSVILRPV